MIEKIFGKYPDKIFEIHISENEGREDSHKVSDSDSWQLELLRQNKKFLLDIPLVFEWCKITNSQIYQYLGALKKLLEN